ncbi:hypothetical protein Gohar_003782 [Gossypium harknessii]|uniref:Transthyretin/hydroxyisourate hydrolase domain-containing protein n=1 Tax=Gossypium harknessii TaxID=34285 RepID=A0A7J9I6A7_9ROSI|nr:hypothetical protein [Gossypium harknessii]
MLELEILQQAPRANEISRTTPFKAHLCLNKNCFNGAPRVLRARARLPITTLVLVVSKGCPAGGIDLRLEMSKGGEDGPSVGEIDIGRWVLDVLNHIQLLIFMSMVDAFTHGVYRISFNTGKYNHGGFFLYASIVFEIKETQKWEHFHVPLLLSPFSITAYRGS